MLACPLCDKEVEEFHKRSHLVPEWMYTDCYNEKHKAIEISRSAGKATKKQKGIYSSFICKRCENETQKYDHYASLILTDRSPDTDEFKSIKRTYFHKVNNQKEIEFGIWENINFKKFQNFVFSIVLRTLFAGRIEGPISISEKHLKRILTIYRDESIFDDTSYPILVMEYNKNDKMRNHVILPFFKRIQGHHIIEFTGGGYVFNLYISNHTKPQPVRSFCLKKEGTLSLINIFFQETALFEKSLEVISQLGRFKK